MVAVTGWHDLLSPLYPVLPLFLSFFFNSSFNIWDVFLKIHRGPQEEEITITCRLISVSVWLWFALRWVERLACWCRYDVSWCHPGSLRWKSEEFFIRFKLLRRERNKLRGIQRCLQCLYVQPGNLYMQTLLLYAIARGKSSDYAVKKHFPRGRRHRYTYSIFFQTYLCLMI